MTINIYNTNCTYNTIVLNRTVVFKIRQKIRALALVTMFALSAAIVTY